MSLSRLALRSMLLRTLRSALNNIVIMELPPKSLVFQKNPPVIYAFLAQAGLSMHPSLNRVVYGTTGYRYLSMENLFLRATNETCLVFINEWNERRPTSHIKDPILLT